MSPQSRFDRSRSIFLIVSAKTQRVLYVGDAVHKALGYDAGVYCLRSLGIDTFSQEGAMILVRNVFQVKFGKMKEARGLWKEGIKFVNAATSRAC
jgi:hypothetical protein